MAVLNYLIRFIFKILSLKMSKEEIETIIMSHSNRGMPILRKHLPPNYCKEAAEYILSWEKGVIFITTGFYVAGHA